jgi:Resolvase, N terminal domain
MSNSDLLPAAVLRRKAVVYVRQSTQTQVQTNLESKRRQYDLVAEARRRGFAQVEVIDDDLGRSASGMVARPGFDRLVAWLAKSAPCCASMLHDLLVTGETGTTCWSSVA